MTWLLDSFNRIAAARTAIGFAQGVALYWLYWTADGKIWPGDRPELLWPLVTIATFMPLLAVVGIGNLRWRPFSIWMVVVTLLCGGLGYHMAAQHRTDGGWDSWMWASLCIPWLLFVTNALVTAAEVDRRPIATFPTYFDVAWKQATQVALALVFIGLFWIVLWLGAALFRAIRIEAVAEIIASSWFWISATTAATAVALHLTDAQLGLVRAARSLLLNLLAWLMPLLVLIGLAFLAALFFTGLAPLWATRVATASLISAATLLILLINSHFQDGESQGGRSRILIYPRFAGALMLVPLVALASYGLGLRIEQYGLTPQRVLASAFLIVLACHAVGYAIAAIASGPALHGLRATNIASAFVSVAVLLAILTPLADPARTPSRARWRASKADASGPRSSTSPSFSSIAVDTAPKPSNVSGRIRRGRTPPQSPRESRNWPRIPMGGRGPPRPTQRAAKPISRCCGRTRARCRTTSWIRTGMTPRAKAACRNASYCPTKPAKRSLPS